MDNATTPAPAGTLPSRNEFDEDSYLFLYPDIAAGVGSGAIDSGWQHFAAHGFAEGRQWVQKPDPFAGVPLDISLNDEMFFGNKEHYFDVGESALHCIETALFAARRQKSSIKNILDLPCGHGRVMRFLKKAFPQAQLTACDLNLDGVAYCAQAFGAIPVFSRKEIDEIPLPGKFDLIWCGSLLTHFPVEKCVAFLQLFQRLLLPGGILVFTTHGRGCENGLATGKNKHGLSDGQIARLLGAYRRIGFGYVDYSSQAEYGFSLCHPSFVTANFIPGDHCRLLGYHEHGWDKRQDVVFIQKNF